MAAIQTALNFIKKSKPISPTSTGGVFIHLSPLKTMDKTKTIIKTYDHTFTDGAIFEIEDRHAMWKLGYKITNVIEDRWQGYLQTQTVTYTLQETK